MELITSSINRLIDDHTLSFEEIIESPLFLFLKGSLDGIAVDSSIDPASKPSWKRIGKYEEIKFSNAAERRVFVKLVEYQAKDVLIKLICKKKFGGAFFLYQECTRLESSLSHLGTRTLWEVLNEN